MGYGLDTTKYTTRKWGTTITWRGEAKGKLQDALDVWQNKLGITFSKTASDDAVVDFEVVWGTTSQWSNQSDGNGKPATGKKGTLNLTTKDSLGTILHEIGHLLGASHEQDRVDGHGWFAKHPEIFFGVEGAKLRAKHNKDYGDYEIGSIMHYPASNYAVKSEPTAGDIATAKAINGWA